MSAPRYAKIYVSDVRVGDRIKRRQNSEVGRVYDLRSAPYSSGCTQVSLACGTTDEIFDVLPEKLVWIEIPEPPQETPEVWHAVKVRQGAQDLTKCGAVGKATSYGPKVNCPDCA